MRPAPHRLESRKVAAVLPAHRWWRHVRDADREQHLLPGEQTWQRVKGAVARMLFRHVWHAGYDVGRAVGRQEALETIDGVLDRLHLEKEFPLR